MFSTACDSAFFYFYKIHEYNLAVLKMKIVVLKACPEVKKMKVSIFEDFPPEVFRSFDKSVFSVLKEAYFVFKKSLIPGCYAFH